MAECSMAPWMPNGKIERLSQRGRAVSARSHQQAASCWAAGRSSRLAVAHRQVRVGAVSAGPDRSLDLPASGSRARRGDSNWCRSGRGASRCHPQSSPRNFGSTWTSELFLFLFLLLNFSKIKTFPGGAWGSESLRFLAKATQAASGRAGT